MVWSPPVAARRDRIGLGMEEDCPALAPLQEREAPLGDR